ncbi:MAG: twin-arginine translocation signal domain-containing protein [Minicystis sp.]
MSNISRRQLLEGLSVGAVGAVVGGCGTTTPAELTDEAAESLLTASKTKPIPRPSLSAAQLAKLAADRRRRYRGRHGIGRG